MIGRLAFLGQMAEEGIDILPSGLPTNEKDAPIKGVVVEGEGEQDYKMVKKTTGWLIPALAIGLVFFLMRK